MPEPAHPYVLMYHSVTDHLEDPYQVTVSPARFEQQLRWLERRRLRGVGVGELLAARAAERAAGLVGLTFDDGYEDFATLVAPMLTRFGFTATTFVLAGRLGGHNAWDTPGPCKPLMTEEQVRQVARAGMEIGSHGWGHVSLPGADAAQLAAEISDSRELLGRLIGQEVAGFCYPYGHLDASAVAAVQAAGYDYGCAIWRGPLTGRHALPRTFIGQRDHSGWLYAKRARHWLRERWEA